MSHAEQQQAATTGRRSGDDRLRNVAILVNSLGAGAIVIGSLALLTLPELVSRRIVFLTCLALGTSLVIVARHIFRMVDT